MDELAPYPSPPSGVDEEKEALMHDAAYEWGREHVDRFYPRVLEFGARNVNGSLRSLFSADHYHGVDIAPGEGVAEVADAADWRLRPGEEGFDLVVCTEVLEHAPRWRKIVGSCYGVAKKEGGEVLITCATDPREPHSAVDGGAVREGEYYGNVPVDAFLDAIRPMRFRRWDLSVTTDGDLRFWAVRD